MSQLNLQQVITGGVINIVCLVISTAAVSAVSLDVTLL